MWPFSHGDRKRVSARFLELGADLVHHRLERIADEQLEFGESRNRKNNTHRVLPGALLVPFVRVRLAPWPPLGSIDALS